MNYQEMKVNVPEGKIGEYSVEKFVADSEDIRARLKGRAIPLGTYTKLMRGDVLVMSDTPAEIIDHVQIMWGAKGKVLIAGLGIGLVLNGIAKKEEVDHITVIEISPEVIELVGPHYKSIYGDKIEIINANILEWKPAKDIIYDYAWYDIWDHICTDNLEDMKKLHRRFGRKVKSYQGSWNRELCESYLKQERRSEGRR